MTEEVEIENIYDEVEIDDMDFEDGTFYYPCPCGDKFQIKLELILKEKKSIAQCPSCSLQIRVIFDQEYITDFAKENGLEHLLVEVY